MPVTRRESLSFNAFDLQAAWIYSLFDYCRFPRFKPQVVTCTEGNHGVVYLIHRFAATAAHVAPIPLSACGLRAFDNGRSRDGLHRVYRSRIG